MGIAEGDCRIDQPVHVRRNRPQGLRLSVFIDQRAEIIYGNEQNVVVSYRKQASALSVSFQGKQQAKQDYWV